eukprot:TRINITY_DN13746_c0_g1_i1.p1 TRINITY_DN13746_c0_g1~~TRINITY_DN13746_c0_g1_i1.p1  ORF type:complete len:57 (+),score=6.58 TRINITY_DN13746_c0_g1_i1:267-437(+)
MKKTARFLGVQKKRKTIEKTQYHIDDITFGKFRKRVRTHNEKIHFENVIFLKPFCK